MKKLQVFKDCSLAFFFTAYLASLSHLSYVYIRDV
jgi:hypothetical protein